MNSKLISQNKNPFLHREEIILEIESNTAPSFENIKKEIGKDPDLTTIKKINSNFGRHTFTAEVFIYDSKQAKDKLEKTPKSAEKKSEKVSAPAQEVPAAEEKPKEDAEQPAEKKADIKSEDLKNKEAEK